MFLFVAFGISSVIYNDSQIENIDNDIIRYNTTIGIITQKQNDIQNKLKMIKNQIKDKVNQAKNNSVQNGETTQLNYTEIDNQIKNVFQNEIDKHINKGSIIEMSLISLSSDIQTFKNLFSFVSFFYKPYVPPTIPLENGLHIISGRSANATYKTKFITKAKSFIFAQTPFLDCMPSEFYITLRSKRCEHRYGPFNMSNDIQKNDVCFELPQPTFFGEADIQVTANHGNTSNVCLPKLFAVGEVNVKM